MSDLDDLDAEERQERRQRMQAWSRLQGAEVARAKRVLDDPLATAEQKRDAKILIGTYAVDPVLMAASGSNIFHYGNQRMVEPSNRHPKAPLPPGRTEVFQKLRQLLRRKSR